jgi:hypothetical protein
MNEKILELGERRKVALEVWLNDGGTFQPTDCTWQLMLGTTPESKGNCELVQSDRGWKLVCEVQPLRRAMYRLQYSFQMGSEIVKRTVPIKVI